MKWLHDMIYMMLPIKCAVCFLFFLAFSQSCFIFTQKIRISPEATLKIRSPKSHYSPVLFAQLLRLPAMKCYEYVQTATGSSQFSGQSQALLPSAQGWSLKCWTTSSALVCLGPLVLFPCKLHGPHSQIKLASLQLYASSEDFSQPVPE